MGEDTKACGRRQRPSLGERTAVYLIGYELAGPSGAKEGFPVELLRFQRGRAVAGLYYTLV